MYEQLAISLYGQKDIYHTMISSGLHCFLFQQSTNQIENDIKIQGTFSFAVGNFETAKRRQYNEKKHAKINKKIRSSS